MDLAWFSSKKTTKKSFHFNVNIKSVVNPIIANWRVSLGVIARIFPKVIVFTSTEVGDIETINKILGIEVGFSFFSKDGIFNQLISTGTFELIKNEELKKNLLDLFNHQKDRNTASSNEIDSFNLIFRNEMNKNFRIRFSYNSFDGEFYGSRALMNFYFDEKYYFSNSFYGLISQAQQYVNMYMRQLKDIEVNYKTVYALSKEEVKKDI